MNTSKPFAILSVLILATFLTDLFFIDYTSLGIYEVVKMILIPAYFMMVLYKYIQEKRRKI